jgi:hypothetical protein
LKAKRLVTVCRLLNEKEVRYAVVGAFALALHGAPRATNDVDILLDNDEENVRRALDALSALPLGLANELTVAEVAKKPLTIIGDDPRVDLITIAWSVRYADAAPRLQKEVIDGVEVPYVDIDTLIRSKRTDRLRDKADVEELERLKQLQQEKL